MATLVLGAVGTLVGGPLGGALGALAGVVDADPANAAAMDQPVSNVFLRGGGI